MMSSVAFQEEDFVMTLKSYRGNWKRHPTFPQVRLGDGETVEVLVVGEPWSFELPKKNGERFPPLRHITNVIPKNDLDDLYTQTCSVWELSDSVFKNIPADPTGRWIKITRHGSGKNDTTYEVAIIREATDEELQQADKKIPLDLELVASEKQSLQARRNRS